MPWGLEQLARTHSSQPLPDAVCLARFLAGLPDPRARRGRRFPLIAIVAAAAASVLAGARSLTAVTEWIADAPRWVLLALGFSIDPFSKTVTVPHPTTVMRLLGRLDGDALDAAVSAFLQTRGESVQSGRGRRAVVVDGNVLRGSRSASGKAVWLLAAMDHTGTVLGQRQIDDKSNETPAFIPLLTGINLQNTVITADTAHTQHANGTWLREHNAHYIAVVKANHPGLLGRLRKLPWRDIRLDHYDQTSGHHRIVCTSLPVSLPGLLREPSWQDGSAATGRSRISSTMSATPRSPRTPQGSAAAACPAPWPPCATSRSACSARTAGPTSPPPAVIPPATHSDP